MDTTLHISAGQSDPSETRAPGFAKPQKAFAVAFAVLAATLAGCASGLGANTPDPAGRLARVEEGTIVASVEAAGSQTGVAYTIRLPTGELVAVQQTGDYAMPTGMAVLIEYGPDARVIPHGYSS